MRPSTLPNQSAASATDDRWALAFKTRRLEDLVHVHLVNEGKNDVSVWQRHKPGEEPVHLETGVGPNALRFLNLQNRCLCVASAKKASIGKCRVVFFDG